MTLEQIYNTLDALSPFELQEKWDNSRIIVGEKSQEIIKVYVSIDIDEALLDEVEQGSLIIVHHPLIFSGLKSLDFSTYPSKLLRTMIKKDVATIAMHTNFDKTHLNRYVAQKVLGFEIESVEDFVVYMKVDMPFDTLALHVKKVFTLEHLKCVKQCDVVKRVALTTGSGASLIPHIEADLFLTGDIKYHDAMAAKVQNLSMIDIAHFESERFFGEILAQELENLELEVIISSSKNPFTYM